MLKTIWDRLICNLGHQPARRLTFEADQELIESLRGWAEQEQRAPEQVAADLLAQAVGRRKGAQDNLHRWEALSPREQQVAALICLDYTNRQIAVRLSISPETVKTHVHNLLAKFNLQSKVQLRRLLADWDFSAWERRFE